MNDNNNALNNQDANITTNNNTQISTEEVGEHDIVIDDDFEINLAIADVSKDTYKTDNNDVITDMPTNEVNIGTEQSGNITF